MFGFVGSSDGETIWQVCGIVLPLCCLNPSNMGGWVLFSLTVRILGRPYEKRVRSTSVCLTGRL